MQANALLWCAKCGAFRHHVTRAKYGHWGERSKNVERCTVCLTENGNHEVPATVDAPNELSRLQIAWCRFHEHRVQTGTLTEWPGDWWDATPGVWGEDGTDDRAATDDPRRADRCGAPASPEPEPGGRNMV